MSPYRPADWISQAIPLGVWQAPGRPDVTVTLTFDTRLLSWMVNEAAKSPTKSKAISLGKPPIAVTLT